MKNYLLALALSFSAAACASAQTAIERQFIAEASLDFPAFVTVDNASTVTVDNTAWNAFLERYLSLDESGLMLVDYGAVTDADKAALKEYVAMLEATDPTALSSDEQFAYWLNFYNALTIDVILDNYPLASIRDIKDNPLDFKGPWNNKRVTVNGEALSLDDIEHAILRPIYAEPRIHYGVNCASIGCPNLQQKAFVGATIDQDLTRAAREFINNPRGVNVEGSRVTASTIFNWFKEDFGENDAEVLDHIRQYADPDLAAELEGRTRINRYEYDWALNDGRAPEKSRGSGTSRKRGS